MTGQLTLAGCGPDYNPELGQWHTPPWLARRMVDWSGAGRGLVVLEPSAGGGAIVRELVAAGAGVVAVEIDPRWSAVVAKDERVRVVTGDFLQFRNGLDADLAVMNPPLDGGEGPVHIAHALHFCPRVVSLLRTVDMHGVERHEVLWSKYHLWGIRWLVRRPAFSGKSGANEDFVVVDVRREPLDSREYGFDVGWW